MSCTIHSSLGWGSTCHEQNTITAMHAKLFIKEESLFLALFTVPSDGAQLAMGRTPAKLFIKAANHTHWRI
jgi:hypothetical protein